jgi:NIPSNAP
VEHKSDRARIFIGCLVLLMMSNVTSAQDKGVSAVKIVKSSSLLTDFQVVEFRRYTIRDGEREHFAQYFESYFPEAFQQLGAIAVGQFLERGKNSRFTWLRAFHTMDDRAKVNASFYYGPLWKEHAATLNSLMIDSDNVLLLRPLNRERGITILPAVDPVKEGKGAQGIAIAQIFSVKAGNIDAFAQQAESTFSRYREAGAREAAVLVTLDAPNNFPQLPVRTDGPFLVWLGIVENESSLKPFTDLLESAQQSLSRTDLLKAVPEIVVLDPTKRSRLRWITEE